jgi:hypothetical protein
LCWCQLGGHGKSYIEGIITNKWKVSLWALIYVLDIVLDGEDAVARIGVGAEEFGWLLSLTK